MGPRITEIDEHSVAHVLRHKAIEAANAFGNALLVGSDDLAQVLGIHARRKRRRPYQVAEHHGDLAALRAVLPSWLGWRERQGCRRGSRGVPKIADSLQHLQPMTEGDT